MASAPPTIDRNTLLMAPRRELVTLAKKLVALKLQASQVGPQTPEELHALIKEKWGYHIPRIAVDVDHGHCAPFDFLCDCFFEDIRVDGFEVSGALVVANREGAKSTDVAILHALNARFKPGYWGISSGAVAEQSNRVYEILKELNSKWGGQDAESKDNGIIDSLKSITRYVNGSIVNIIGSTMAALNGPHSNLLHRDEGDLFRRDAFDEGDNITKSGLTTDGRRIKAIDIVTSSLKFAKGIMQELIDGVETAIKAKTVPRYKIYKWGIAETIANQSQWCRYTCDPSLPETERCPCRSVVKGKMADGSPRTLEKICAGRFARSDGWRPLTPDVVGKFLSNSSAMWDAQQECRKAAAEGLILQNFSKQTHCLQGWTPDPERGLIYNSNDVGSTHASASLWFQYTEQPYSAISYDGHEIVIPKNSYIFFDEVYITEVGNNVFANYVKTHEMQWKQKIEHWEICERYMDIAAKSQRLDFANTHGLPTFHRLPSREVEPQIEKIIESVDDGHWWVVLNETDPENPTGCVMLVSESESWQRDPKTGKPIEKFDDCMAAARYGRSNHDAKLRMEGRHPHQQNQSDPASSGPATTQGPVTTAQHVDLSKDPQTGPAFKEYMRGSPHDHEELLPMRGLSPEQESRMGRTDW